MRNATKSFVSKENLLNRVPDKQQKEAHWGYSGAANCAVKK
jgi:hypothetical protein